MNEHSCHSDDPIHSVSLAKQTSHFVCHRLFLQTHAFAHQRLRAAYQRLQALLAQEQQEPTLAPEFYRVMQSFRDGLIKILCVLMGHHADPRLSCLLTHKARSQYCMPGSPQFSKRLRLEYVNHIFLRRQHQALKNNFYSTAQNPLPAPVAEQGMALMSALQEALAEAEAANHKILIAFEGYLKMLSRAQE